MVKPIYILGLEGSANKLGVGITDSNQNILANVRSTYNAPQGQGFIPIDVVKHHRTHILRLIQEALTKAQLKITDISKIAYTRGPGMGGPLSSVLTVAKTLSLLHNIPLVPVNHCIAHIEMGRLVTGLQNPVVLYASGSNTQIIAYTQGKYRIFGEALDIAVGNCLDRIARELNLPNDPAPGLNIELQARKYTERFTSSPELIPDVPVSVKGMDISCSGLQSWITKYVKEHVLDELLVQKICYSVQEYLFAALVEIAERSAALLNAKDFLCVGGVGCNERLQQMITIMAKERGGTVGAMDERYCVDNGAMISWCGHLTSETVDLTQANISQRWRTDQVDITWRD